MERQFHRRMWEERRNYKCLKNLGVRMLDPSPPGGRDNEIVGGICAWTRLRGLVVPPKQAKSTKRYYYSFKEDQKERAASAGVMRWRSHAT